MEGIEIIGGNNGIGLDPPREDGRGMFLDLGLVQDPVQGKQVDLTGLLHQQVQVLVHQVLLQYQVCIATRLLMFHFLGLEKVWYQKTCDGELDLNGCLNAFRWR